MGQQKFIYTATDESTPTRSATATFHIEIITPLLDDVLVQAGNDKVRFTWNKPENAAYIAKYQYKLGDNIWIDIVGSDNTTTSYTVTNLTPNTAYTFKIQALDNS